MNLRETGILLLKLWGLYVLVHGAIAAIHLVVYMMPSVTMSVDRYVWMASGLNAITQLTLAAVLLTTAEQIVAFIMPDRPGESGAAGTYSPADVQTLVFGGIGAFFAISGLADLAQVTYRLLRGPAWDTSGTFADTLPGNHEELAGAIVQITAAVILLFGRRGLAAAWARVHPMGETEPPAPRGDSA